MNQKERLKELKKHLVSNNELYVNEACQLLQVSPATIRRDFNVLLKDITIDKTWGGIVLKPASRPTFDMTSSFHRQTIQADEKRRIAEAAASLVHDGDVIIVDGGTTTFFMTKFLASKNIRVITNSILIAHSIDMDRQSKFGGAEVFLTGGFIYPQSGLLAGPQAIANIKQYHANMAFLSVSGIESDLATNSNQLIVETERAMIAQSEKIIMLADSSKFGKKSMVKLCNVEEIDVLITDHHKDHEEMIKKIKEKNVEVIEV